MNKIWSVNCLEHNRLELYDGEHLIKHVSLSQLKQHYRDYGIGSVWIKFYEDSPDWCCLPKQP